MTKPPFNFPMPILIQRLLIRPPQLGDEKALNAAILGFRLTRTSQRDPADPKKVVPGLIQSRDGNLATGCCPIGKSW